MAEHDKNLDLGLGLGLGSSFCVSKENKPPKKTRYGICLDLSLPQQHTNEQSNSDIVMEDSKNYETDETEEESQESYSNKKDGVMKMRKKLRLNKEQSTLLEECFKQHNTLTMGRKHELATKLNLRPRQVEVWFQNRRARTKLKQTEIDCKLLKKYCESLNYENCRLRRELLELRASFKIERPLPPPLPPFSDQVPKAKTTTTCGPCEKMTGVTRGSGDLKTESEMENTVLELKTSDS